MLKATRFTTVHRNQWTNENVQRDALERVGRLKLKVKELDDWYRVRTKDLHTELSFIKNYYNGSLFKALKKLHPHHNWNSLRFRKAPQRYWDDEISQREALENFGREVGVQKLDDWYSVNAAEVHNTLRFLHPRYGSLFNALKKFYPQHEWDPLRFNRRVPSGTWSSELTQREALERLGREHLGIKELDDWYSVTAQDVQQHLSFVTIYYNGSLVHALKKLYPEHHWDPLRFHRIPTNYWKQEHTVTHYRSMFMNWKESHNIRSVRDWHQLPPHQLKLFKLAAKGIFGSTTKMLMGWFPDTVYGSQYISQIELQSLLQHIVMETQGKFKVQTQNEHECVQLSDNQWHGTWSQILSFVK